MEKGTWVVCVNDNNWHPDASIKMSALPVKNELYQVRDVVPHIPGISSGGGIKLEGIYGEESYSICKNGNKYWVEYHFRGDRFQVVNDLWSFLTEKSDVEEKAIDIRRNHHELINSLLNNGSKVLIDEERQYCNNIN